MCERNSYFQNIQKLKLQFMKTKNLIIAILSIGIIVLAILYFNKCQETAPLQPNISEELYTVKRKCYTAEELCDTAKSTCGAGYGEESIDYIRKLIEDRTNIFNQVYGYQINLTKIDEMYKAIQRFNAVARRDNTDTIQGIRIYEAVSRRQINGTSRREPDLVMLPYLQNCEDVYLVDDHRFTQYGVKMYTHFRPCPRLCSDKKEDKRYIYQ